MRIGENVVVVTDDLPNTLVAYGRVVHIDTHFRITTVMTRSSTHFARAGDELYFEELENSAGEIRYFLLHRFDGRSSEKRALMNRLLGIVFCVGGVIE